MTDTAEVQAPVAEVESLRYFHKPLAKKGTLHVVVGGVHHIFPCQRVRAIRLVEDLLEAIRLHDEPGR